MKIKKLKTYKAIREMQEQLKRVYERKENLQKVIIKTRTCHFTLKGVISYTEKVVLEDDSGLLSKALYDVLEEERKKLHKQIWDNTGA